MASNTLLQVGQRAPTLRLPDSTSSPFDLHQRCAGRRQLLVFYRGHW